MKLSTFSPANVPILRTTSPSISMNAKSGTITFNAAMCEKLSLTDQKCVLLHQDSQSPEDWYLEVVKKDGFKIRMKNDKNAMIQSCYLVRKIFDSVKYTENSGRVIIGQETKVDGKVLYPVITAKLFGK